MNTLYAIIGLFALGAIVGMYLLAMVLQSKETPKAVALIHGTFVGVGLILLILYYVKYRTRSLRKYCTICTRSIGRSVFISPRYHG